jgi:acetyltransferase-like isoleucine patch superfamily enzyme
MNPRIHNYCFIGDKVEIGKGSKVQAFAFIPNGVTIEEDVFIGPHVCFCNDRYPNAKEFGEYKETLVKKGASIGANSTILPGITIGEDAVIGAGSVVTKDIKKGGKWIGTSIVQ